MEDHRTDGRLSDLSEKLSFLKDDGDGLNFITAQIEELCINCNSVITSEEIHDHLMLLCHSKGFPKHVGMLTKTLSILHPDFEAAPKFTNDKCITSSSRPFNLFYKCSENDPESPTTEGEKEMSMSDIVIELGYGCTFNTLHLREILSIFLPLTDVKLSKLVGTIARTCTGIEDAQNVHLTFCSALDISSSELTSLNSWNVDALVDSIKQLASRTNWAHVMEQLDHEGFYIPDERSFSLLMSIYVKACQDPFPLHAICGSVWRNSDGQLSFLRHAVAASPDTFTFAHCSRKLTHVDPLLSSECGNQAWFCLDLLEVLCQLAEMGHIIPVRSILDYPINKFPEILLIGIAQINTAYNFLHNDLFSTLFRAILKDSTKTSVIHHLWRSNPNLVLLGFVDAHFDPDMIFRMLDICQELMILSSVLEKTPFPFSIKLACIASRKEYINLERWLNDNLITYKDAFSKDCLKFLDEVLHDVANDAPNTSLEHSFASIINVYKETVAAFFKVLQDHHEHLASNSNEIFEELRRLHVSSNPQIQSVADTELWNPERSSGDIEAEANAYFHRLFSGQLTIDSIVQLLGRFKGSPEKRERLIFDCIVGNLFEEYRFFPQYPEKQLKLTAVLLGSLIKQQLVTHLTLGIALRGVLDALRKSVDSKMFMFGTTALEQFIDRLIEWPHYCNHILQISHLHGTHADLVSAVERALARVSSCQSDISNGGGDILSADQQQTSTPAPVETMEVDEPSWQLTSSSSQFGQQLSPSQHQQHQGFHDGRLKPPVTSSNNTKPVSSLAWQSSSIPAIVDSITSQKETTSQTLQSRSSQHSTIVASAVSSSHPFVLPSRSITSTGFGAALNIETLVAAAERRDTQIQSPASEVQDKILFMINNISTTNMDLKAKEFIKVLDEQHYPWFAQYMVMKRASIEPNFHDLYLKFLGKVNSVSLNDEIMKATYENCKVLLKSELIKSSSEERSLLKNLGSWLGKFTIGRNYVLLAIEINPKALIIEAYEKGLMIAVIPFTSKILEPCASSLAYRPPNPWTMAILGLLAEIYNLPNLKMNLKFDIEVLFKNLSVDMKVVEPTSLLKGRVRDVEGNPDFSNAGIIPTLSQVGVPAEAKSTSHVSNHPNVLAQYAAPLHLASNTIVEDDKAGDLIIPERVPSSQGSTQVVPLTNSPFRISQLINSNSDSYININPKLSSIGPQMKFQSIIQEAMNEAINEIVGSVVEKSVTIAIDTTIKLVLKDYAAESDDSVIYRAARLMVRTLAGSLAHVTCKDHLRVAFSKQLRNVLSSFNVIVDRAEQIIQIITTDHLDLGCAFIENVSSEKDFMRNIWQNQPSQNRNVVSTGPPSMGGGSTLKYAVPCAYGSNSGQQNMGSFPNSQIALEFSTLTQPLDLVHEDSDRGSMQILSASSAHVGANGGIYLSAETSSIAASFPAATSAELHSVETSTVTKELGAAVLPSSSSPGTEHLGNVVSESLLTTGDALDKYQQVVQKITLWFEEWCLICDTPATNDTTYSHISQLQQNGWLKGDDLTDRLFHILTSLSVARSLSSENVVNPAPLSLHSSQHLQDLSFSPIDSYAKLVDLILKYFSVDQGSSKLSLLSKILSVTVRALHKDAEDKQSSFNPRPYFRMFVNWLLDLVSPDTVDVVNFQVLTSFANAFHALQPLKVPGWSFAWLELVGHRSFMPKILTSNSPKGWPFFQRLLVDLFKFMEPYLRNAEMEEQVQFLYKGTLRVLLVLLHDFPEFLCEYHFSFCDVIPPSCIQMRNVILSAFPRNMRLPIPSAPNLKIDLLAEINLSPRVLSDVDGALKAKQIKADVDDYLKTKSDGSFLSELKQRLLLSQSEASLAGTRYNVPLINSLVLYVGMQAIQQLQNKSTQPMAHNPPMNILLVSAAMDIFSSLIKNLDTEGRYLFINAVANQLRYPNNHTHYFSFVLLYLFTEMCEDTVQEIIQEQITRVLLERLIANRPQPWGLVITAIELVKNSQYGFWERAFTGCTPEIERLLDWISRSFSGLKPMDDGMVSAGIPNGNC